MSCFLAKYGYMEDGSYIGPCQGRMVKAHLIPKQMIKREARNLIDPWHQSLWVLCCGGLHGSAGHHGAFDYSKRLRLPRAALPPATEQIAQLLDEQLGREVFVTYLERTYGS